jgi:hypothetical protein
MGVAPLKHAIRLDVALDRIASYERDIWFYVVKGIDAVGAETICVPISEEEDFTSAEAEGELQEFLSVQDIRSIVDNVRQQDAAADLDQFLAACNYYWRNDAYLQLPSA